MPPSPPPQPQDRWRRPHRGLRLAVAALLVVAACGAPESLPVERPPTQVVDAAGLVPAASEQRMASLLQAVREDSRVELFAVTVPDAGPGGLAALADELFERWRVGASTGNGRGLLLVVDARAEAVRCVVGYELEAWYPDAFVARVERDQMAPWFAVGSPGDGFEATVELLAGRAFEMRRELAAAERPAAPGPLAGGAGAEEPLVAPPRSAAVGDRDRFGAQESPEEAWARFLEINRRRIADPDLGLYDAAARDLLRRRPATPAAQDHIARLYAGGAAVVVERADLAVVSFPDDPDRLLAPWFFRRTAAGWVLDGAAPPVLIGYNHRNQWRFLRRDHEYAFAFESWTIDRHGFATAPRGREGGGDG